MDIPKNENKIIFHTLDAIRGLLAILVVLRHSEIYFGPVSFPHSYMAVDVFFLLSGLVICQAYEKKLSTWMSISHFTALRLVRIYPLYILGCILGFTALLYTNDWKDYSLPQWGTIITGTLLLLPNIFIAKLFLLNGPAWSLFFEMIANVFYAIFIKFLTTERVIGVIALSFIGLSISVYFKATPSLDLGYWTTSLPSGVFRVFLSFFIGIFLFRTYDFQPRKVITGKMGNLVSCLILICICTALMITVPEKMRGFYDLLCVTILFPSLIYMSLWFQPSGFLVPLCRFLGFTSYGIYTLHAPLISLATPILADISIDVSNYAPIAGLLLLVAVLTLTYFMHIFYDVPVRKYLMNIFSLQKRSPVST